MFSKLLIILIAVQATVAKFTSSTDKYLLKFNDAISPDFLLDGPANVSYAPTTPTTNLRPSLEQMTYYNYYCASMYCQYELDDLSCEYCQKFKGDVVMHKVLMKNDQDVTAMVTLSHKRTEIVVTFRGSQNAWNYVLDFTPLLVCYNSKCDIKIHIGFKTFAESLYGDVIKVVKKLLHKNPSYKLVVTGHSLGGAMARLTTFFILYSKQFPDTKLELYTYGEPRVGNKGFADFMNAQHITTARITARADFAPHIIPVSVLGTKALGDYYIHPQPEYWINGKDDQKFANTAFYNDRNCSDSVGPPYSVLDHFQYFELDYLKCYLDQPAVWATLPANLLQPVGTVPPLPKVIQKPLHSGLGTVSGIVTPHLGR